MSMMHDTECGAKCGIPLCDGECGYLAIACGDGRHRCPKHYGHEVADGSAQLREQLAAAIARAEGAERERDTLLARPSAEEYAEGERMQMARAEKAERELAALRAAAEPFVRVAKVLAVETGWPKPDNALVDVNHQVGDYRRLADAYTAAGEGKGEK